MRLPFRRALVLCLAAGLVGVAGCREDPDSAGAPAGRGVPGVVIVCIDTLRADSLTTDAEGPGPMPTLDAFARKGTVFADVASNSSWTPPAVGSLLTGLVPAHSGIRRSTGMKLSPSVETLAARLRSAGWSTWALTAGGMVTVEQGFGTGFEEFRTTFDNEGPEASIEQWKQKRRTDAPFFLFLHTYAAHDPYGQKETLGSAMRARNTKQAGNATQAGNEPPTPLFEETRRRLGVPILSDETRLWFTETFLGNPEARGTLQRAIGPPRAIQVWMDNLAWLDGPARGSPEVLAMAPRLRAKYRAGLGVADAILARTLAELDAAGLPKETAIFVCGDHGEAFGEHGTLSHGRWLYEEFVRMPLVARVPGRWAPGTVVRGTCSLVDVSATVLSLAGLPADPALDGRSLEGLLGGPVPDRPVVAEEERRMDESASWLRMTSVRVPAAKYVRTVLLPGLEVKSEELYDLGADPAEKSSLPIAEATRFGPAFAAAVETARRPR